MYFICSALLHDMILSCPVGVFGAAFLSPPAQQLLLRGPVAWSVGITVVTAHSLRGT